MNDLIIQIGASSKQFNEELDKVRSNTEDLSSNLEGIAVKSGIAFAGLAAAITLSVDAYRDNEQAAIRTNAILNATGGIAGVTASQVAELAESLSHQTTFSKHAVEEGENLLLTFTNIGKDIFPQATQATLDLATRMGGDASGAAQTLGRALNDPIAGMVMLHRAGIQLTASQKAQIEVMQLSGNIAGAQAIILGAVTNSVGGMSHAVAGGTGTFLQLKNAMEELWAQIGEQLAPILISVAGHIKNFVQALSENKDMVAFVAAGLAGLTAAIGSVFIVSSLSLVFVTVTTALSAFGVATSAATLAVIGLAGATGIGLLVAAGTYLYSHWSTVWPQMQAIFKSFVVNTMELLKGLGSMIIGLATGNLSEITAGFNLLKETLATGFKKVYVDTLNEVKPAVEAASQGLANAQVAINKKRILQIQADEKAHNAAIFAYKKANAQLQVLEDQQASDALIAIKKNEVAILKNLSDAAFQGDKEALRVRLIALQADYDAAAAIEVKKKSALYDTLLKTSDAYKKMDTKAQAVYLDTHKKALLANIDTEETAQQKAADFQIKQETDLHNTALEKQAKFGKDYATLWNATHSVVLENTKTSFSELENLTQSHNDAIKGIGKAAAIANIIMKTRDAAMNIFEGFSTIPFVGYALGIAAAAAAIAYGGEQIATVLSAAQGGIVTGGISGRDSVPALLMPGELVVPNKNFNEVVNAVAQGRSGSGSGGSGQNIGVTISLSRDASQFLTAKQNEDKALGLSRARSG